MKKYRNAKEKYKQLPRKYKILKKSIKIGFGDCPGGQNDIILHHALHWSPELQAVDANRPHSLHGTSFKLIARHKCSSRLQLFGILRVHGAHFPMWGTIQVSLRNHVQIVGFCWSLSWRAHGVRIYMCSCVFEDCFVEEYVSMISFGFCPLALIQ